MASSSAEGGKDGAGPSKGSDWTFVNDKAIGSGSFGTVYMAVVAETGKVRPAQRTPPPRARAVPCAAHRSRLSTRARSRCSAARSKWR